MLAAIVFVATSGCTWRQLPPVLGLLATVYERFARWSRERVRARLYRVVLDELGSRGQLDWSRCAIGPVSIRALKGGAQPLGRHQWVVESRLYASRHVPHPPLAIGSRRRP